MKIKVCCWEMGVVVKGERYCISTNGVFYDKDNVQIRFDYCPFCGTKVELEKEKVKKVYYQAVRQLEDYSKSISCSIWYDKLEYISGWEKDAYTIIEREFEI